MVPEMHWSIIRFPSKTDSPCSDAQSLRWKSFSRHPLTAEVLGKRSAIAFRWNLVNTRGYDRDPRNWHLAHQKVGQPQIWSKYEGFFTIKNGDLTDWVRPAGEFLEFSFQQMMKNQLWYGTGSLFSEKPTWLRSIPHALIEVMVPLDGPIFLLHGRPYGWKMLIPHGIFGQR